TPPTKTPTTIAVTGDHPALSDSAVTTLERAMAEPTERSIPPLTIIIVMPIAPMATITVWASTIRRLLSERYRAGESVRTAKIAITRISPMKGPSRANQVLTSPMAPEAFSVFTSATIAKSGSSFQSLLRWRMLVAADRSQHHRLGRPFFHWSRGGKFAACHHSQAI